jgi:hypothetical protein
MSPVWTCDANVYAMTVVSIVSGYCQSQRGVDPRLIYAEGHGIPCPSGLDSASINCHQAGMSWGNVHLDLALHGRATLIKPVLDPFL